MPNDSHFDRITIKRKYAKQYLKRANRSKRALARQLEFDLLALGALRISPSPYKATDYLKILQPRVAELEKTLGKKAS